MIKAQNIGKLNQFITISFKYMGVEIDNNECYTKGVDQWHKVVLRDIGKQISMIRVFNPLHVVYP